MSITQNILKRAKTQVINLAGDVGNSLIDRGLTAIFGQGTYLGRGDQTPSITSVDAFVSNFNSVGGFATTSRFMVTLSLPAKLGLTSEERTISLLCYRASIPGISLGTDSSTSPYGYGPVFKAPWGVVFGDLNLAFYGDGQGKLHNILMRWFDLIANYNWDSMNGVEGGATPFFMSYPEDYLTTMKITALNVVNQEIITYNVIDVYPAFVGDIDGDWGATDTAMIIPVRFNFTRYTTQHVSISTELSGALQNTVNGPLNNLIGGLSNAVSGIRVGSLALSDIINNNTGRVISSVEQNIASTLSSTYQRGLRALVGDFFN